jgi:hypothetical protein
MRGEPDDPAVSLVPEAVADWMRVIPTPPVHASLRVGVLDPGEIAVLSVALNHPGWEAGSESPRWGLETEIRNRDVARIEN